MSPDPGPKKRLAFVGAGAIGSYVGGRMAQAGLDVTLIDPWGQHVDMIKRHGVAFSGTEGTSRTDIKALHIHELQSLIAHPVDIAFIAVKSYDTEWATVLIRDYLSTGGFVVSLQNGINEESIAQHVGWGKTMGCVASTIGVSLTEPGHVRRTYQPGGSAHTIFRVGEVHGRITPRVKEVVEMLRTVDSADATTDLWGDRWAKLTANSMHNALAAASGLTHIGIYGERGPRRIAIRLGGEAVRVGRALGFDIASVRGVPVEALERAALGDEDAMRKVEDVMHGWTGRMTEEGRPSTAQDVMKGRRTEIESINGLVVRHAERVGIPVPYQSAILALVRRIERGSLAPSMDNITAMLGGNLQEPPRA
jgi:2-dehydropantoate 2-reductase